MDQRGKAWVGKSERSGARHAEVHEEAIKPEKFGETHLQDLAHRVNGVLRDSAWHFECAMFLRDLGRLLALPAPPSRRA